MKQGKGMDGVYYFREVIREGHCPVTKKQVLKNVRKDGKMDSLTLTEWLNDHGPRRRRRGRKGAAYSFVTGIISSLAKPALKSHRLMLQGHLIINEKYALHRCMKKTTTVVISKYPQHFLGDQSQLGVRRAGSDIFGKATHQNWG